MDRTGLAIQLLSNRLAVGKLTKMRGWGSLPKLLGDFSSLWLIGEAQSARLVVWALDVMYRQYAARR